MSNDTPIMILLIQRKVFSHLSIRNIVVCRSVSKRWRNAVDNYLDNENLWKVRCKDDFKELFKEARRHRSPELRWCELYQSLSWWWRIRDAVEDVVEFLIDTTVGKRVTYFNQLRCGFIAIITKSKITFLNVITGQEGLIMYGDYKKYAETNGHAILLNCRNYLMINRKVALTPYKGARVFFAAINTFVILDHIVVIVTTTNKLLFINLDEEEFGKMHVPALEEPVLCAGLKASTIYVLTLKKKIYKLIGSDITLAYIIKDNDDLLNILLRYNLTDDMDWLVYKHWMNSYGRGEPLTGILHDITTVKKYGKIVIIGTQWSDVLIYQISRLPISLYKLTPVKAYNLSEKKDKKFLNTCPVIRVDVLEGKDHHLVVTATPNKIIVIKLQHVTTMTEEIEVLLEKANRILRLKD